VLLTDGCPNTTEDLRVYESSILDVASGEFIDLKTKLELATAEISEDVIDVLLDRPWAPGWVWGDPQGAIRRTVGVSDVVVTKQLKRWHALHTLALVYRDAFNNQLNDRYQAKVAEYSGLEREAREHTLRFGIGLVIQPIPRPAAPANTLIAGTSPGGTYYVQATWVDANGVESAPSPMTAIAVDTDNLAVLAMANAPAVAAGYNVFAGFDAGLLALQNPAPVAVGQTFTLGAALNSGRGPTGGQTPDVYVTMPRLARRG
jgi:hypothetical protein